MKSVKPWLSRLPFLALNLVVAAGLTFGLAKPLLDFFGDGDESLAERRVTLARYREVAAHENEVRDYVRQVKEGNTRGDLLEGSTVGIVTAALQARLKAMADAAGVVVLSIEALPLRSPGAAGLDAALHPAGGDPSLIGARISVSGSPEAVHVFTRAIENGPPLLLATSALMSPTAMNWLKPTENPQPTIQAQIDVYGGALTKDRP